MRTAKQTGSSLVEVMVALFVLAIGLLGILAMQSKSMQYNQSAHVYSQAVYLANDIAERIRLNPTASYLVGVDQNVTATTDCVENACPAEALAQWDLQEWKAAVDRALPSGKAEIEADSGGAPAVTIKVSFDDSRSEGSGAEVRKTYALVVGF
jgi:type IV pilus assembly protein PilV